LNPAGLCPRPGSPSVALSRRFHKKIHRQPPPPTPTPPGAPAPSTDVQEGPSVQYELAPEAWTRLLITHLEGGRQQKKSGKCYRPRVSLLAMFENVLSIAAPEDDNVYATRNSKNSWHQQNDHFRHLTISWSPCDTLHHFLLVIHRQCLCAIAGMSWAPG
jgi:hypothetical protein